MSFCFLIYTQQTPLLDWLGKNAMDSFVHSTLFPPTQAIYYIHFMLGVLNHCKNIIILNATRRYDWQQVQWQTKISLDTLQVSLYKGTQPGEPKNAFRKAEIHPLFENRRSCNGTPPPSTPTRVLSNDLDVTNSGENSFKRRRCFRKVEKLQQNEVFCIFIC